MAHNYTITFRSLRSSTTDAPYVVTIGGGTESTIALKPAASPFVTEEGDDEDVFCPVRTQTGYIRIVDDGYALDGATPFDWKDLIPLTDTARPVTLTQGGTVLWQGFMQSQNFGATLYGNPQEREYPIQCSLASAAGQDIVLATSPVTEMKNFAFYLKSILDYIVSVTPFYEAGKEAGYIIEFANSGRIVCVGQIYASKSLAVASANSVRSFVKLATSIEE